MVTILSILENMPAHIVYGSPDFQNIPIEHVVAGDLMSDILVSVEAGDILVTSLATEQAIRTADIVCAAAVLLVNDKLPTHSMKELAESSGITLLATPLPLYDACVALGNLELFS
ncbi:MAG: hypothetical protein LBU99_02175 [Spirochaetaceae bacterium]|jgi:hypothetical protein|nr:hypothetical protein [Spirochaetaceae bacterium]